MGGHIHKCLHSGSPKGIPMFDFMQKNQSLDLLVLSIDEWDCGPVSLHAQDFNIPVREQQETAAPLVPGSWPCPP